jgi:hypothetical protein
MQKIRGVRIVFWRAFILIAAASGIATCAYALAGPGFSQADAPPPQAPVLGRLETVTRIAGNVLVRIKGASAFVRLAGALSVRDGSEIDATAGRLAITVATLSPGQTASAVAYQGRFLLHQDAFAPGETHLTLSEPLACRPTNPRGRAGRAETAAASKRRRASKSRHVWVSEQEGGWGTNGNYVSTTVEGTRWFTGDECGRSTVKVAAGTVVVDDRLHHRSVSVRAGHQYVAVEEGPALMPPLGQVLTGVTGGSTSAFGHQVRKHPAVFGYFATWGEPVGPPLADAHGSLARLLLHISTDIGYGGGSGDVLSPAAIANGAGDGYLVDVGKELTERGQPAYIALLPEMNQANNAYSAFDPSGAARDGAHSTANFRQAWRRSVLIVRGGSVAAIDRRLRNLHLPPVRTSRVTLPAPQVAFMWAPQTAGTPDVPANEPAAYYPGSAYVDIVGTDFYSAFPNFAGLAHLYAAHPSKPFGFNEWGMWLNGDPGFVRQLFAFVHSHRRVGLMVYNQGLNPSGPFRLYRFPAATQEIRDQLTPSRFLAYTPDAFN